MLSSRGSLLEPRCSVKRLKSLEACGAERAVDPNMVLMSCVDVANENEEAWLEFLNCPDRAMHFCAVLSIDRLCDSLLWTEGSVKAVIPCESCMHRK